MDYVVGSVAALVSGNVTPNRPRLLKRALTPTKHPASPNVTPKSEFVDDRSIFLSPTLQKKKAVVKKSPKRIFQNPDLECTDNGEGNLSLTSPKADKVKKHLEDDLDNDTSLNKSKQATKSPKKKGKNKKQENSIVECNVEPEKNTNESTPKKTKQKNNSVAEVADKSTKQSENVTNVINSPNKIRNRRKSLKDRDGSIENDEIQTKTELQISDDVLSPKKQKPNGSENTQTNLVVADVAVEVASKKKNKKRNKKSKQSVNETESPKNKEEDNTSENIIINQITTKKNRKRKKSKSEALNVEESEVSVLENNDTEPDLQSKKTKTSINPNAVTDKESDSEHESDDEIDSENEEINKKVFETEANSDESSDEDDVPKKELSQKEIEKEKREANVDTEVNTEEEIKKTLFVGNVLFSPKCKKEIKKIFSKHGKIETIRIRTVPVKDGRYTPKLALIKNELHPERTTVNVYIRYADEESVEKALCENNTVLNEHHLRVSRSSQTGKEHDPKCSIFIGNLPFAIEDEVLRQKFENCGEIKSVRIIRDKKTNAGKGFGYVNFASKDGVELALALTEEDLTIKNRIIRVKRCTQVTNKQKQTNNHSKRGFKNQGPNNRGLQEQNQGNQRFQRENQDGQRENQGFQRGNRSGFRGNRGGFRGSRGGQRENQGFQRGNRGGFGGNQGSQRGNRGGFRGNQGSQRGNQGIQRGNQSGPKLGMNNEEGAYRRLMHKRKSQEGAGNDGPPNKMQKNVNEPSREKKAKKEFVGMTAEKKKKRKFDKGQKKKKALSEILTK